MKRTLALLVTLVAGASLVLAVEASPAHAAIVVNETADELNADGDCSLAEAVQALNSGVAVDACPAPVDPVISLPAGTFDAGIGLLVTSDIALVGAGAGETTIDCSGAAVCVNNFAGDTDVASLTMGTVGGHHVNQLVGSGSLAAADAVFEDAGNVSLRSVEPITLVHSRVVDAGNAGVATTEGAFVIDSEIVGSTHSGVVSDDGPVSLQRSTISGSGQSGVLTDGGSISVLDSTVASNGESGLRTDEGDITVVDSTIARNAGHGATTVDGAIHLDSSTIAENRFRAFNYSGLNGSAFVVNSILANDIEECDNASMVSGGYNLTNDDLTVGCNFDQPTDQIDVDPLLGTLGDNGGPMLTYLPQPGSPAIDRGGECPGADQRGQARPADGDADGDAVCDVGSVEVQPTDLGGTNGAGSSSGAGGGASAPARALPLAPRFTG